MCNGECAACGPKVDVSIMCACDGVGTLTATTLIHHDGHDSNNPHSSRVALSGECGTSVSAASVYAVRTPWVLTLSHTAQLSQVLSLHVHRLCVQTSAAASAGSATAFVPRNAVASSLSREFSVQESCRHIGPVFVGACGLNTEPGFA
jgi:hypothetical protein